MIIFQIIIRHTHELVPTYREDFSINYLTGKSQLKYPPKLRIPIVPGVFCRVNVDVGYMYIHKMNLP